jgi:hypothetical protein
MVNFNFNSIGELLNRIDTDNGQGTQSAKNMYLKGSYKADWYGGINNLSEYQQSVKNGYLPAVEQMQGQAATTEGNSQNLTSSNSGQFGDVAKYLSGEPECMFDFETQEANNYLILNIDAVTPYTTKGNVLMNKCKAIFNAVNILEATGTRVKINISIAINDKVKGSRKEGEKIQMNLLVKDYQDNFITSLHGLLIGNLATVRGIMYAYLSIHSKSPTLGSPIESIFTEGKKVSFMNHSEAEIKRIILN